MEDLNGNIYREDLPNFGSSLCHKLRQTCQISTLKNLLPIFQWLPKYQTNYIFNDVMAGFTVGLTTIPQAIAYGVVAGLEPQNGLYSAFMGCFMYIFFGSCKDVTIATTAIMALMVYQYSTINPDYAVFICFLVGCIILILGLLNLGVLVRFISIPVICGFTMAAAITIASAQLNNLFGLKSPSNQLIISWRHFFTHLSSIRLNDSILGVSTLIFLLIMKKVKDIPIGSKLLWKYISLSRNALAVIIGTFLAYQLSRDSGIAPFIITGNITAGLPPFKLPPFSTTVDGEHVPFSEMINTVGVSLASIPMIAILEIVAISKAFSKGKVVDASQEMIALGVCNIMGSFVSSMPVTGSFTRTAVNNASGVKTPLGGAVTGSVVLMALAFLTQTFYYIPKSTLAAIIIAAMISLIELHKIPQIWRTRKLDMLPFAITLGTCVFWNLEYGIVCGLIVNLCFILYGSARPEIDVTYDKTCGLDLSVVYVKSRLYFASAEYLKEKIIRFVRNQRTPIDLVVICGQQINAIDYSVAMNIASLKDDLRTLNCELICWKWNICSCGVISRLRPDLTAMFKYQHSLQDVINDYKQQQNSSKNSYVNLSYH